MQIEICANSFESAQAAQEGGAHRIELCTNLALGGLTPSRELIKKVHAELSIPTHVLIRPRSGNFSYSEKEINEICNEIEFCQKIGCAGVVSGALTTKNDIDVETIQRFIASSNGIEFTFHRAFDVCREPIQTLNILMELEVTRLLSSGQKTKAIEGLSLLTKLKSIANNRIEIMPGSGINDENAFAFKEVGFSSIHFSAIRRPPQAKSTSFFETGVNGISDIDLIRKIIGLLA